MSRWRCVVVALLVGGCSSGAERFCTLGLAIARVEVDVVALPSAEEVCVGPSPCVPVRDGAAELAEPLVSNAPAGMVTFLSADEVAVTEDVDGSGRTRSG